MKYCPNNHENPDNASFCRICGCELNKGEDMLGNNTPKFTLDEFPEINLVPRSVYAISFKIVPRSVFFAFLLMVALMSFFFGEELYDFYYYEIDRGFANELQSATQWALIIFAMVTGCMLLIQLYKKILYKLKVDYIEAKPVVGTFCRIAKNGKLGLLDISMKRMLLFCKYTNITTFDKEYLLVEQNGLKGIYSLPKRKFIVPIKYDKIDPINKSVLAVYSDDIAYHYDINGNELK